MSTSITANRINERERFSVGDFKEMSPNVLLVRGCKPSTKTEGGLLTPGAGAIGELREEKTDHPLRGCPVFEVIMLPVEMTRGNPHNLRVGDVVLCRNVLVDPLLGNEFGITDFYDGVAGLVERAA